jgi:P pilus assembly chaperone PapD
MKRNLLIMPGLLTMLAAPMAAAQQAPLPIAAPKSEATQVAVPVQTAAANINITPRRVIFDATKRTEAVYVFNQGTTPVTVDVALIDNAMLSSGEIVPLARLAERGAEAVGTKVRSAKPFVLAAPSRLILPPGQGKTVRVRATLADSGTTAEYRTHLTVTTVPPADTGLTAEQAAAADKGELVLRIQSVFGISIPLIVRGGTADATGGIGAITPATTRDGPALSVTLQRKGTTSLYGNIELRTAKEVVGAARGIAVYPETDERQAVVPLLRPLKKGEQVTAIYSADDGKKAVQIASGTYTAP